MSWPQCEPAESCSLAVPVSVVVFFDALHVWVALSLFWLRLPPDVVALLHIVVIRSLMRARRWAGRSAQLELRIGREGLYFVDECSRSFAPESGRASVFAGWRFNWPTEASKVNDTVERVVPQHQGTNDSERVKEYTCCRSVRVPGCIVLTLVDESAKPLEILVFYRYYQREFYRRLLRRLALQ